LETPESLGVLNGHVKNDELDIIPPFSVIDKGTTTSFPGRNMDSIYGAGFTGAEVLANNCMVPGSGAGITVTEPITTSATVPVTVTTPSTTVTIPGEATTAISTATITVPEDVATADGGTTIVTIPADVTTTVSLPGRTVTVPPLTVTAPGQTVERPAQTVTLPGTTVTVTGAATTTVVTVTGPNGIVHQGVVAKKRVKFTITTRHRVISIKAGVHHLHAKGKVLGKKIVVVIVRGCPRGTVHSGSGCGAVGKG
jgi:hypothetical protein